MSEVRMMAFCSDFSDHSLSRTPVTVLSLVYTIMHRPVPLRRSITITVNVDKLLSHVLLISM